MSTMSAQAPAWRRRLYLPAYRMSDAARYAGIPVQAVSYWFRGGGQLGPALDGKEPGRALSYLELVEVAFVATYRQLGMPLQRLRRARSFVAQRLNAEHPFAEYEFRTIGLGLYMAFAEYEPDPENDRLVAVDRAGQLAWAPPIEERFEEFEYENDLALIWYPSKPYPLVTIDSRVAYGAPTVGGIPTWVLKGRAEAGESLEEMSDDFRLDPDVAKQGLGFEGVPLAA